MGGQVHAWHTAAVSSSTLAGAEPLTIDLTTAAQQEATPSDAPPGGPAPQASMPTVLPDDPRRRCTARPSLRGATASATASPSTGVTVPSQRTAPDGALPAT